MANLMSKSDNLYDTVIVGGGVAGLSAAINGGRLGLRVLLLEKNVFGGSFAVLETVSGYLGIESIGGWEFTQNMVKQAKDAGCELIDSTEVFKVEKLPDNNFGFRIAGSGLIQAKTVIVSAGGEPLMLELADEIHFAQHGIHTCVQCAGARYRGKTIAIAGNNSWSVLAADHMLKFGCSVLYTTRDTELYGDAKTAEQLLGNDRFRFLGGCHITGLYGKENLEEILVTSLMGGNFQKIAVSAVFVYRGIKPNSKLVPARKDRQGFLLVDENLMTSLPGVFAAGRILHADLPVQDLVDEGSRAVYSAAAWLQANT
jgi:thioredoxin reductase (NADPH)